MKKTHVLAFVFSLALIQLAQAADPATVYTVDATELKVTLHKHHFLANDELEISVDGRQIFSHPVYYRDAAITNIAAIDQKIEQLREAGKRVQFDTAQLGAVMDKNFNEEASMLTDQSKLVGLVDSFQPAGGAAPMAQPAGAQSRDIVLDVNALVQAGYTVVCPVCSKDPAHDNGAIVKIVPSQDAATPAPAVLVQNQAKAQ